MRDLILRRNPSQPPLIRGGEDVRITDVKFIPYNKKLVSRARELRSEQTQVEKVFWTALSEYQNLKNYKFTRQKPLDNFIVDFYCAKLLLAIEIDGEIHSLSRIRDQERDKILQDKYNIWVIRYSNDQVINNVNIVLDDLSEKINCRLSEFPPDKGD